MTSISDLPGDLLGEILSKVVLTSLRAVRLTCKRWNSLSKYHIFGKEATRNQFLGFMMIDYKVCSMRLDFQGNNLVYSSIKQVSLPDQVQISISEIFHCGGLLLCVAKYHSRLLVWNPYLGQTRWVFSRTGTDFHIGDNYSLGHDNNNNHLNHKILKVFNGCDDTTKKHFYGFEIYDLNSNSWRLLDVKTKWDLDWMIQCRVILKGNTYFLAQDPKRLIDNFLLCFDFTQERFGPPLTLPFSSSGMYSSTLSCTREDQLAVLHQRLKPGRYTLFEIWVTTKIETKALSWSKLFKVAIDSPVALASSGFPSCFNTGSFFFDEEKKVAVVTDLYGYVKPQHFRKAYIISNDGCFKCLNIGQVLNLPIPDVLEQDDSLPLYMRGVQRQDPTWLLFLFMFQVLVQVQLPIK
ncbi:hypothetical protein EUTSA_v10015452mg [Eutrema salsugineum]|uniref:F-box domain-containing protein n=1 Tax=Eutrema salsugineum TaxID=72664 RepID=V4LJ45_EUTSA|nr:F-box/kelch-repeat protein At3g13680 [Eutrema salsugineum]ESQ42462.1 hypothetical protein EUTSA_v10015452mg [Eutrema salsugineum]